MIVLYDDCFLTFGWPWIETHYLPICRVALGATAVFESDGSVVVDTPGATSVRVAHVPTTVEVTVVTFSLVSIPMLRATDLMLLDAAELERADKFATPLLRGCYVRSHALLRRVVASRIGEDAASLRFERSCENCGHPWHGRPRLLGSRALEFSLSNSGPITVVACGAGPLGADVEMVPRSPVETEVISRLTTPLERRKLMAMADGARSTAFLDMWTCKEAVVKALGIGLKLPFSSFDASAIESIVAYAGAPPLKVTTFTFDWAHVAVAASPSTPIILVSAPHED
jgi:4'-phosphopantetheinyl transferase